MHEVSSQVIEGTISVSASCVFEPLFPYATDRVMLDLETIGNTPGSAIVAIGAVRFSGDIVNAEFYKRVSLKSCIDLGMTTDAGTVLWWLQQSDAARQEIVKADTTINVALMSFFEFATGTEEVWGNGADFDNVLLEEAYRLAFMPQPWKWSRNRCYRTLKSLYPHVTVPREGTHHNALDDAKHQHRHLMAIFHAMQAAPSSN